MTKTKKLFSVIALAFIFALACVVGFANISFVNASVDTQKPDVYKKSDGFWMEDGAQLYVGENKIDGKDANGIRFFAYISKEIYNNMHAWKGNSALEFGTLISNVNGQNIADLTLDSVGTTDDGTVIKAVWANQTLDFDENDLHTEKVTLYNFPEELFNTQLTVRSYVSIVGYKTWYTESGVQRSFAAVADKAIKNDTNNATYGGKLDKYVGGKVTELENLTTFATDTLSEEGVVTKNANEVVTIEIADIKANSSVTVAVNDKQLLNSALTVEDGKVSFNVSALGDYTMGTEYPVSVFIAGEGVWHTKLVCSNFAIKTAADLKYFTLDIETLTNTWGGYYILANDIDATGYTHTHSTTGDIGWGSVVYTCALTGTFDGLGHAIKNFNAIKNGLFGLVNGGTIKNLAFTNVTFTKNTKGTVFAERFWSGKLDNVYVQANAFNGSHQAAVATRLRPGAYIDNSVFEVAGESDCSARYGNGVLWYSKDDTANFSLDETDTSLIKNYWTNNVCVLSKQDVASYYGNFSWWNEAETIQIVGENKNVDAPVLDQTTKTVTQYKLKGVFQYDDASSVDEKVDLTKCTTYQSHKTQNGGI